MRHNKFIKLINKIKSDTFFQLNLTSTVTLKKSKTGLFTLGNSMPNLFHGTLLTE